MSQGKQNKFLNGYFIALGVIVLGLGWLAFSASSAADEAKTEFDTASGRLRQLQNARLFPSKEHLEEKQKRVAKTLAQVKELSDRIAKHQVPFNPDVKNTEFQGKLATALEAIRKTAAERGVKLFDKATNFDFAMGKYLSTTARPEAAPVLAVELDGLNFLVNTAMESGIRSIDALTREELPIEKDQAAPAEKPKTPAKPTAGARTPAAAKSKQPAGPLLPENKVLERFPIQLRVTGRNDSITSFLNTLATLSPEKDQPHVFTTRIQRIENQIKKGPDKSEVVGTTEDKDPQKPELIIKRDAKYIFGNEEVRLYLDLDLIRFLPVEDEAPPAGASAKASPSSAPPPSPPVAPRNPAPSPAPAPPQPN